MNSALFARVKPVNRCKILVGILIVLGPALFFEWKYVDVSDQAYAYAYGNDSDARNSDTNSCDMMVMQDEVQIKGYVVLLHSVEQMESALYGLYQILSLTTPWRMQLVEPFMIGATFGMVDAFTKKDDQLRFSDMFNLPRVNQQLGQCLCIDYSPIIPFERYMTQTFSVMKVLTFGNSGVCLGKDRANMSTIPYSSNVNKHVISEAFCVKAGRKLNFAKLFQSVVEIEQTKLAVVIPSWYGLRPFPTKFFYTDPHYKERRCRLYNLESSNTIMLEAERFIGANLKRPYFGIHLRFEILNNYKAYDTEMCIRTMIDLAGIIRDKYNLPPDNIVAFTDYGKYGSGTCGQHKCRDVADSLQVTKRLEELGIRVMEYEPSISKYRHSAFISTVEREILALSEYLLVAGSGAFQISVVNRFLHSHTPERFYSVCFEKRY